MNLPRLIIDARPRVSSPAWPEIIPGQVGSAHGHSTMPSPRPVIAFGAVTFTENQ